jgi:hypothetical protein
VTRQKLAEQAMRIDDPSPARVLFVPKALARDDMDV